ncbi:MAG: TIR domain-containing protein [Actinomycetota bacterium]
MAQRKARVFVSFDFDNDAKLKAFIVGQAKLPDSPFEIENWSLNEPAPDRTWQQKARARIARSDVVLVMVGPKTHAAKGVLAEVAIANELRKPIRQIIGYKDSSPTPVPGAGRLYRWSWSTVKTLLTLR